MNQATFPKSFLWGASTAATQIEGSPLADGAGESIWHRFSRIQGRIINGDTPDVGCDHYRRWRDDVKLMKEIGLRAYRFSIAWGRILPEGVGEVNQKGIDFYRGLVDALVENGIVPMATLYHWDLPAALDERGGWLNRDSASWFAEYAETAFRALDDGVRFWATINEPWVVMDGGYLHGTMAPGHASPWEAPLVAHNLLRAHGQAVAAYRAIGQNQIGIVLNLEPKVAASDSPADLEAVQRTDAYMNRQFLDPLFKGSYPEELREVYGEGWKEFPSTDLDVIGRPIDFLGINYYKRGVTAADPSVPYEKARRLDVPHSIVTTLGWESHPDSLRDLLVRISNDYTKVPLYVTENGAAFYDPPVAREGRIEDPLRVDYLRDHFRAAAEAIARGVDLRGYFVWSLLDNYEWTQGYSQRFGIVHVDYGTQRRTVKESGKFYAEVILTNGASLSS